MSNLERYDPLQWPPNIKLAELHYNCSKPGIDNPEGAKCPCCDRFEKLENSKWPRRDIAKDFKNYGGGVPGYFYLITYFVSFLLLLTLVKVIYHIVILQKICPHLQHDPLNRCTGIFGIFKFCSAQILYQQSVYLGYQRQAIILQYLNLTTYLILVGATIGIKIFLQYLNKDKISLDEKLFSKFSLVIKNVPLYYQLQDLKEQFKVIDPKTQINQMFYLHKYCKFQKQYRAIFDLYFKICHLEQQTLTDDREKKIQILRQQYHKYIELYDNIKDPSQIKNNSKKILVVFNTIEQKQKIHDHLRMNGLVKFTHYFFRLFKSKIEPINYYSERLTEPQEVLWKNIGESSTKKQKVRIQTTIIGFGFMILTFAVLYFPMYWVDQQKVNKPGLGTGLGTVISIIIIILAVVYRMIIIRLMPTRRPSSKLAEAFFIILTTIVFHFFFYVVTPATFYIFAKQILPNDKLKEFFSAVFLFSLMVLLVATLDLKYRFFNKRKEKLLAQASQSNNYCQQRLHEELTPPSFPIQFKLMVIFNIWTFNSFYIFEIPYLIFLFMIILAILFWIDKRNLYLHYKTQQYISIELEIKVQKTYIIFFLICVSGGYYLTSVFTWEKITIGVIFILAIIINFALNLSYKKHKDNILRHNTNLKNAIQQSKKSFAMITHINMMQQQLKNSFLAPPDINEFSSISLASELISYGYLQTYKLFKMQFKNKIFNQMLHDKYISIKKSKSIIGINKIKENQLPKYNKSNIDLNQPLMQQKLSQEQSQSQNYIINPKLMQQQQIQIKWEQQKIVPNKNQNSPFIISLIEPKTQIAINNTVNDSQKIVQQQYIVVVPQTKIVYDPLPVENQEKPIDKE